MNVSRSPVLLFKIAFFAEILLFHNNFESEKLKGGRRERINIVRSDSLTALFKDMFVFFIL